MLDIGNREQNLYSAQQDQLNRNAVIQSMNISTEGISIHQILYIIQKKHAEETEALVLDHEMLIKLAMQQSQETVLPGAVLSRESVRELQVLCVEERLDLVNRQRQQLKYLQDLQTVHQQERDNLVKIQILEGEIIAKQAELKTIYQKEEGRLIKFHAKVISCVSNLPKPEFISRVQRQDTAECEAFM